MTPQQVENLFRQQMEAERKQYEEKLTSVSKETEALKQHASQLEEFKREKDAEYAKSRMQEASALKDQVKALAGDNAEALSATIDQLAGSRESETFFNFLAAMNKNQAAMNDALRQNKKEIAAMKRRETQARNVSVKASQQAERAKRVRQVAQRTGQAVRPVGGSVFDIVRSPVRASNGSEVVAVRSSRATSSTNSFANQHTLAEGEDVQINGVDNTTNQQQQQQQNPVDQWREEYASIIYARCGANRDTAERLIERRDQFQHFFPQSMSNAAPELFNELVRMRDGNDTSMPVFGGTAWGGKFSAINLAAKNPEFGGRALLQ